MPDLRRQDVAEVLELLYGALEDPTRWHDAIRSYANLMGSDYAQLIVEDQSGVAQPVRASTDPAMLAEYLSVHRHTDPYAEPALVSRMSQSGRAFVSHELIEDRDLRQCSFYNDFLRPHGNLFWSCGGSYALDQHAFVQFWASRDKAHGSFDEHERHVADDVVRHLLRAVRLGLRLARLKQQTEYHDGVQNLMVDAVLVLDGNDRIVCRNALAGTLMSDSQHPHFIPRSLKLAGAGEQQKLLAALVSARATPKAPPQTLRLQRQPPLPPLYAVVTAATRPAQTGTVQIFLRDPRWQKHLGEADLINLYQLTPAQARACAAVVRGEDLEEYAQRTDVRLSTVRTQIKGAMEKIGMHRQSDLVRHLSQALPALIREA